MSTTASGASPVLIRSDKVVLGGGLAFVVVAGLAHYGGWNSVLAFVVSAAAVCLLASLVGRSVEQLGDRFGPGATGVLQSALGAQSYEVLEAGGVQEGLELFEQRAPEAVLLDLGLPDGEGFELLERIRETSETPIVIISARGEERDQVRALDSGANDYVTKPFREGELLARLRSALRIAARANRNSECIVVGSLRLQCFERRAYLNDVEVELTPTEFSLLQVLARDAGRVMTHRQLLRQVWGPSYTQDVQYLRVFMKQLRTKLERDPSKPKLLVTTPGVGYRLKLGD